MCVCADAERIAGGADASPSGKDRSLGEIRLVKCAFIFVMLKLLVMSPTSLCTSTSSAVQICVDATHRILCSIHA